jgi:iron complex transport system substrate-binding protein
VGVCEPQYIISPKVRARVDAGEIADLGQATSPNIEKIIACGGEIIIASPYENVGFGVVQKIGIPIIQASDYMERDPLGRTEWIRFYGLLLRKEAMADSIFLSTANSYNSLKELSKSSPTRPKLLTERKYGSTWFLPGAKSYMVRMYSDAGAEYIFNDISSEGSVPMSFETVLDRAMHADVWVMKYDMDRAMRYQDLLAENPLYAEFDPFKNHNVYTCNTVTTQYYGDIMLHPDYILADLVYIFHPELLEGHQLRYYQKMAE